jgi:hypothetical protein
MADWNSNLDARILSWVAVTAFILAKLYLRSTKITNIWKYSLSFHPGQIFMLTRSKKRTVIRGQISSLAGFASMKILRTTLEDVRIPEPLKNLI